MAVHRELAAGLVEQIRTQVDAANHARSINAAVAALVELACTEPVAPRRLFDGAPRG